MSEIIGRLFSKIKDNSLVTLKISIHTINYINTVKIFFEMDSSSDADARQYSSDAESVYYSDDGYEGYLEKSERLQAAQNPLESDDNWDVAAAESEVHSDLPSWIPSDMQSDQSPTPPPMPQHQDSGTEAFDLFEPVVDFVTEYSSDRSEATEVEESSSPNEVTIAPKKPRLAAHICNEPDCGVEFPSRRLLSRHKMNHKSTHVISIEGTSNITIHKVGLF